MDPFPRVAIQEANCQSLKKLSYPFARDLLAVAGNLFHQLSPPFARDLLAVTACFCQRLQRCPFLRLSFPETCCLFLRLLQSCPFLKQLQSCPFLRLLQSCLFVRHPFARGI